jgi:hypothetical protein
MELGISKTCSFWCQNVRGAHLQRLINAINFGCPPVFVSEAVKKGVCREIGGVELTMMKASTSKNSDNNGEVVGILVYEESIIPYNGGWYG